MEKVAIIGAGKIAYSLTGALVKAGLKPAAVISRTGEAAEKLAEKFEIESAGSDFALLDSAFHTFFICVNNDSIKGVAELLSSLDLDFTSSVFIHMSGSVPSHELESVVHKGGGYGSVHILQSFPTKEVISIEGCFCVVDTPFDDVRATLNRLASMMKLNPVDIRSDMKTIYHTAAVFSSNFINAVLRGGEKLFSLSLEKEGGAGQNVNYEQVFDPIIEQTLRNIRKHGAVMSLSGPVERNDIQTIRDHLARLTHHLDMNNREDKYIIISYLANSLLLTRMAAQKTGADLSGIEEFLYHELNQLTKK